MKKTLSLPVTFLNVWATKVMNTIEAFTKVIIPRGVTLDQGVIAETASTTAQRLLSLFKNDSSKEDNNKLLVISSYPAPGSVHGKGVGGIAAFAKNTVVALKNASPELEITVLGEKLPHDKKKYAPYRDEGVRVKRVWERNSFSTFFSILKQIMCCEKDTSKILMEFGFSIYGDMRYLLPLPFFLLALRLMRKKMYFVFHEVVPSANDVAGHMNLQQGSFKARVFDYLFKMFYRYCLMFVTKSIVLEDALAERLKSYGKQHKVAVIPIGVEKFDKIPTKQEARKRLHIDRDSYVLLSFGFLAWYKGTDWVVSAIEEIKKSNTTGKKVQLILAGGPNKDRANKAYYQKYVESIERKCEENGIILTGFVAEEDIPYYFAASDLVLFPYRILIGASAPLTLAFTFNKPFIVSDAMSCIFKANDMQDLLKKIGLRMDDVTFELNREFTKKIHKLQKSVTLQEKLTRFSKELSHSRAWNTVGQQYYNELF